MSENPRYRVTAESFIHNALVPEGAEIEFLGQPGSALEPLNDAAKKAKAEATKKGATLVTGAVVDAHEGDVEKLAKERAPRKAKDEPPAGDDTQSGSGDGDEFA